MKHDVVYSMFSDRGMSQVVTREAEESAAPEAVVLQLLEWLGESPMGPASEGEFSC